MVQNQFKTFFQMTDLMHYHVAIWKCIIQVKCAKHYWDFSMKVIKYTLGTFFSYRKYNMNSFMVIVALLKKWCIAHK